MTPTHVKDMTLPEALEYQAELQKQLRYAHPSEFDVIGWDLEDVKKRILALTNVGVDRIMNT